MGLRGHVVVEHKDKNNKLLHSIDKHNTITDLGKAASLFFGVSALGLPNEIHAGYVYPTVDSAGGQSSSSTPVWQTKGTDTVVECSLLETQASAIANDALNALFAPSDSDIIGFAKEKTSAGSLTTKEGIRVVPLDELKRITTASAKGNKASFAYQWTGIEGALHTIAMKIPQCLMQHSMPSMLTTTYKFIPAGLNGVPDGKIAFGGAGYDKLLDLDTLAITDFTPVGSYSAPTYHWNSLRFGNYIIESLFNSIRVINIINGTTYTEAWSMLSGCWIENDKLYAATTNYSGVVTVYELTVSDSAITSTVVTTSDHIDSTWTTNVIDFHIAGLSNGKVMIMHTTLGTGSYKHNRIVILDSLLSTTPIMTLRDIETGSSGWDIFDKLCVYLDNIIYYEQSAIATKNQYGILFSFLDLESNWTINATDTVTVTYTYELTEVA